MARLSQAFLSNLGRPAMTQSLFDLGTAIGNVPSQYQEKKKRDADAAELATATTQPERMRILASQLERDGKTAQAQEVRLKARALERQGDVEGREDAAYGVKQSEQIVKAQGLMNQMQSAVNSGKLTPEMQQEGESLLESLAVAGQGAVGAEEIVQDFLARAGISAGDDLRFGAESTVRDSNGNYFTRRIAYDKDTGTPREIIIPYPGSPDSPEGEYTVVSGTTGAGAFDKPGIAGSTATEKEYGEMRAKAAASIPQIRQAQAQAKKSLELLKGIKTGGWTNMVVDEAQRVFGATPKDRAAFALLAGETILEKLDAFPGAISDGEREYLERLYQGLQRSNGANEAILEEIIAHTEWALKDAVTKVKAKNFSEYVDLVEGRERAFSEEDLEGDAEETKSTVSWNDLP